MFGNLGGRVKYLGQAAARMLVGVPDYDTYVQHMKDNHPDKPVMTYKEFFRERQQASLRRRRQRRHALLLTRSHKDPYGNPSQQSPS